MTNPKLYSLAVSDIALITVSLILDFEPQLRLAGVLIGIVVGLVTLVKLVIDIKRGWDDARIKKIERLRKEEEFEEHIKSRLK